MNEGSLKLISAHTTGFATLRGSLCSRNDSRGPRCGLSSHRLSAVARVPRFAFCATLLRVHPCERAFRLFRRLASSPHCVFPREKPAAARTTNSTPVVCCLLHPRALLLSALLFDSCSRREHSPFLNSRPTRVFFSTRFLLKTSLLSMFLMRASKARPARLMYTATTLTSVLVVCRQL